MRPVTATERAEERAMYKSIPGDKRARLKGLAHRRRLSRNSLLRQRTECAADTSVLAPASEKEDERMVNVDDDDDDE